MSSSETWSVLVEARAHKIIERAPRPERERLRKALAEMQLDPFAGDVVRLKHERTAFRRRVGDWRIFFDVYHQEGLVKVPVIERRSSTTYSKRR